MQIKPNTDKIRVLHLIQNLGVGGAEILLLQYIKSLKTDDYEHFVYSIGADEGPMRKMITSMGIPLAIGPKRHSIRYPIQFATDLVNMVLALLKFIKKHRIQIIHSHLGEANQLGVLAGKLSGVPIFPTIHNTNVFKYDQNRQKIITRLRQIVDKFIYHAADRVIAISEEIKAITQEELELDPSMIVVVKNGIIYNEDSAPGFDFRDEIGAAKGDTILIGVGSLTYQKAFEVLIKASVELLKKNMNTYRVAIIGKGREQEALEALIRSCRLEKHVKLLGYRPNVLDYLRASDIFIMPSRYEGLSIAMIEAMACGMPIVASDAPGLSTYIEHQYNGLLFKLEDPADLADKIMRLIDQKDLKTSLSQNAQYTYDRSFDMRLNILPLDNLFREFAVKTVLPSN